MLVFHAQKPSCEWDRKCDCFYWHGIVTSINSFNNSNKHQSIPTPFWNACDRESRHSVQYEKSFFIYWKLRWMGELKWVYKECLSIYFYFLGLHLNEATFQSLCWCWYHRIWRRNSGLNNASLKFYWMISAIFFWPRLYSCVSLAPEWDYVHTQNRCEPYFWRVNIFHTFNKCCSIFNIHMHKY